MISLREALRRLDHTIDDRVHHEARWSRCGAHMMHFDEYLYFLTSSNGIDPFPFHRGPFALVDASKLGNDVAESTGAIELVAEQVTCIIPELFAGGLRVV